MPEPLGDNIQRPWGGESVFDEGYSALSLELMRAIAAS